jgi:hypothetical protein
LLSTPKKSLGRPFNPGLANSIDISKISGSTSLLQKQASTHLRYSYIFFRFIESLLAQSKIGGSAPSEYPRLFSASLLNSSARGRIALIRKPIAQLITSG